MTRTATLLAFAASVSLSAQTTPAPAPALTVTGCVAEVQRDGSLGPKATGTGATTPETAPMEANNPTPTNRYQLIDATPATPAVPAGSAAKPTKTTYALRGQEAELAKHVGHRVQIGGSLMAPLASKVPSKAASTADGTRTVQVSSVKMVGSNCSVSEGPK
jgi:hypothetical protein